ncbi:hypothetical protein C8R42DRAFT_711648 [Lentinula raphanica]|nr:hypothetical protein C8R42DRAFT_711648 [Lentinula raphanica]
MTSIATWPFKAYTDDEGTLVESDDFTDKWFQTQAEDLGEVENWLALQVEALSIPQESDSRTPSLSTSSGFPFSRKRQLSHEGSQQGSQEESSVGAGDGGGGRGGRGEPGRPAHASCGCNGQSIHAHKRRKAAHHNFGEEEDEEEDTVSDPGVLEGGELEGNQKNSQETATSRWTVSSVPATASPEVRHSAMTLLLEIGMGEGTSLEYSESTFWLGDLLEAIKGSSWEDLESLQANNLKESGQVQKATLRPILGKLIRDEKLQLRSLLSWYSAGSRWGRLASGGTVYLLMVIARKPSIASKLKGKRVTSTTIVELANMLRYPHTPEIQNILRECVVPLLIKVAKTIPLEIPIALVNFEQLNIFWQEFKEVTVSEEPVEKYSLCPLTSSYLGGSQISHEPDTEDEKDNLGDQSDLPIFVDNFTTQENINIVFSTFSYAKSAKGKKKYPFTKNNRQSWTEEMRQKAEEGTVAKTLDELAQGNSQKWLRKTQNLAFRREIKVMDSDKKLIFYSNGTLSPAECRRLLVSLTTFFHTKPAGLSLVHRDKNKPGRNMFSTFHFSTWGHYGQNGHGAPAKVHPTFLRQANGSKTNTSQFFMRSSHDLQVHSKEYDLVCEILGELLERIVKKVLHLFPDDLKNVEANLDTFPLNDHSPVKPFTSFVLNLNVETVAHKDNSDNSLCIVLDLGSHTGGGLCLFEPKDSLSYQKDGNGWDGNMSSHSSAVAPKPAVKPAVKKVTKATVKRTSTPVPLGPRAAEVSTIEEAFPMDKHSFFLDVARSTASAESLVEVFEDLKQDTDLQKLLTSFKAREFTASYYALPGTRKPSEVKEIVTWLLTDGHFKYGGVNIETQTFDNQKPFEADGIAHLLRLEYFATKGGANIAVFKEMVSAKRIKAPTVALIITVLEHALMEYSEGTYCNSEFTDSAKSRYHFHLASYNRVAQAAPTWADRFEMNLFNLVLNQSNKTFLLDVEADDMKEVDLASLEANAVAAGASTNL